MINYGSQSIDESDIEAVVDVMRSSRLTQGPAVAKFEHAIAGYTQSGHAIACSNGTMALHLACMALEVGPGDLVWTSAISFVASANCARFCGADIDFIDIDPETCNLSLNELETKLNQARHDGRLPKVLIVVHMAGMPCDMQKVSRLADQYGFHIIEDASHALGSRYQNNPVGACQYSTITTFSFHPVKSITTGEGGALVTNDADLAAKIRLYANHGISRDPLSWQYAEHSEGAWYYEQSVLGLNARMSDIQAALGTSQLRRLGYFLERRQRIDFLYRQFFAGTSFQLQLQQSGGMSACHLFIVQLPEHLTELKAEIFSGMAQSGVQLQCHYIPIPCQPYYRNLGARPELYPNAVSYYRKALSLPIYPDLDDSQSVEIAEKLLKICKDIL